MKKRGILIVLVLIVIFMVGCETEPIPTLTGELPEVPWSFFSMHVENIDEFDQCFDDIIALADEYNAPLTLLMWPQMRDHILNKPEEMAKVQQWITNGHEIGIHAQHCCDEYWEEPGGCLKPSDKEKYKQLVYPHEIKTAHVATSLIVDDLDIEAGFVPCVDNLPESVSYHGIGRYDGRTSMSFKYDVVGKTFYDLHIKAGYLEPLEIRKGQYNSLNSNEIYGAANHAECDLENLEQWFIFLSEKDPEGKKRKTQRWITENVIIPNEQYIDLGEIVIPNERYIKIEDVLDLGDEKIERCSQLITGKICNEDTGWYGTTDRFNFGRCLMTDTYCFLDEKCTENENRPDPNYLPTKCTLRNIDNLDGFKPVSELCPSDCPSDYGETPESIDNCGDGICDEKELDKGSCPEDCDNLGCGDRICSEKELDHGTCPQDCDNLGCGDGVCSEKELDKGTCPGDCS